MKEVFISEYHYALCWLWLKCDIKFDITTMIYTYKWSFIKKKKDCMPTMRNQDTKLSLEKNPKFSISYEFAE